MINKVLISGANKGIGFETARQLGQQGWSILLGARSEKRGLAAVAELKFEHSNEIFGVMPGGITTDLNGNTTGPFMKTLPQGGKIIVDLLTDGKHHQGKVLNEYGVAMDYEANYSLKA